eukprot:9956347-Alexandrium_andersonii.AAC.1
MTTRTKTGHGLIKTGSVNSSQSTKTDKTTSQCQQQSKSSSRCEARLKVDKQSAETKHPWQPLTT